MKQFTLGFVSAWALAALLANFGVPVTGYILLVLDTVHNFFAGML